MLKNTIEIKKITSSDTIPIRHEVMWPHKPVEFVQLPEDENGTHFGLFVDEKLTSIISLFETKGEVQFRKFATLIECQGMGYGTLLLNYIIDLIAKKKVNKLWCNARVKKSKFYESFKFSPTNKTYLKGGIEFVVMERVFD